MKLNSVWLNLSRWNRRTDRMKASETTKEKFQNKENLLLQFLATIAGCLSIMSFGTTIGWSSPSIPYLMSDKSELTLTVTEGAWITSIPNLGLIIGCLLVSLLVNRLGRKYTLLLFSTFQIVSWIIIIFSKNFATLCFGRFFGGVGSSSSVSVTPIYIGEIAEKKIRGTLCSFQVVFNDLGVFFAVSAGAFLPYNILNLLQILIPLLHITIFVFMPESPYSCLMFNREKQARDSLMKFRGLKTTEELQSAIEEIKITLNEMNDSNENKLKQLFYNKSNRKAFMIVSCAIVTSMCSGSMAMLTYAQEIFSYSGFSITSAYSVMITVAIKIIAGLAASQLMARFQRRTLFLFSGVSCSISLGLVGLFFFYKYHIESDVSSVSWLPLVCFICFQLTAVIGLGPMPLILYGEFFSIGVKQVAVPILLILTSVFIFLVEFMFPLINRSLGIYVSFWIFGTCCFVGSITFFCIMPETRGKSLEEIQSNLNSK